MTKVYSEIISDNSNTQCEFNVLMKELRVG